MNSTAMNSTKLHENATRVLLAFVRQYVLSNTCREVAQKFCANGTTLEALSPLSKEEISTKLHENGVIMASNDLLLRFIHLTNSKRGDKPLISGVVNVEILLAAYKIVLMPEEVFPSMGDLEQIVCTACKPLLEAVDTTVLALAAGLNPFS
jgi:hypothetical protein